MCFPSISVLLGQDLQDHVLLGIWQKYVENQINKGREKPFTKYFYPVCKYLYIPVCFLVLILGIVLGGIG